MAGRELYDRQIRFLLDKDVDGLIDTNYAPDAELISFQNVIRGSDALKTYFRGYLEMLGDLRRRVDGQVRRDRRTRSSSRRPCSSALGRARVYDAFVARDGRIAHHFTGVMGTSDQRGCAPKEATMTHGD